MIDEQKVLKEQHLFEIESFVTV